MHRANAKFTHCHLCVTYISDVLVGNRDVSAVRLNCILKMKLHISAFAFVAGLSAIVNAATDADFPACVVRHSQTACLKFKADESQATLYR